MNTLARLLEPASEAPELPASFQWSPEADLSPTRVAALRLPRDSVFVVQDDPALYCYLVVSGCARTTRMLSDGRRQIGEFLFPGDVFGWEAGDRHEFGAEAVTNVTLQRFCRRGMDALAHGDTGFSRRLRELASSQIRLGRKHMLLLGRMTAIERVATFILEMAERLNLDGSTRIPLPMGRADMADYLGITLETVCRQLTRLRLAGAITVEHAKIVMFDRALLEHAAVDLGGA